MCKQATIDYVAMTPEGQSFDTSLAGQSRTYDVRIGSSEVCHVEIMGCTSGRMCAPSCQVRARRLLSIEGRSCTNVYKPSHLFADGVGTYAMAQHKVLIVSGYTEALGCVHCSA